MHTLCRFESLASFDGCVSCSTDISGRLVQIECAQPSSRSYLWFVAGVHNHHALWMSCSSHRWLQNSHMSRSSPTSQLASSSTNHMPKVFEIKVCASRMYLHMQFLATFVDSPC